MVADTENCSTFLLSQIKWIYVANEFYAFLGSDLLEHEGGRNGGRESEQEREQVRERERGDWDRKTELAFKSLIIYWASNNLFTTVAINFALVLNPQYTCQHLWVLCLSFLKRIESINYTIY